jgi:glycosyltransferase involved in cell wall biosynthesis
MTSSDKISSSSKTALLIGTMPPPVHGQSICFQLVVNSLKNSIVIDRNVDQMSFVPKTIKYLKAFATTLFVLVSKKPSIVYISLSRSIPGLFCDCTTILLASVLRLKIYGHLHGNDFLISKFEQVVFGPTYRLLSSLIVLSSAMAQRMNKRVNASFSTLINPINAQFLGKLEKPTDDIIRVVFFSNFMQSKGIHDFIKLARALENESSFEFHVIGDIRGDYLSTFEEMKADFENWLNTSKNLTYHGALNGNTLVEKLSLMDVLVFPSFYIPEAFPLSILECAAVGQYIVLNDHNDLSVFKQLLPHIHVCNTSDTGYLRNWLQEQKKSNIRLLGEENALKARAYSATEHVRNLKEILEL